MTLPHATNPPGVLLRAPRRPTGPAPGADKPSVASSGRLVPAAAGLLPALKRVALALWQRVVEARMAQARREIAFARERWPGGTDDAADARPIPTRYY